MDLKATEVNLLGSTIFPILDYYTDIAVIVKWQSEGHHWWAGLLIPGLVMAYFSGCYIKMKNLKSSEKAPPRGLLILGFFGLCPVVFAISIICS